MPTEADAAVSDMQAADPREKSTRGEDRKGYYAFSGGDSLEICTAWLGYLKVWAMLWLGFWISMT